MIYRKTKNYDSFKCIADKCPENCCSLWQIVIDDESLEKYEELSQGEAPELRNGIDWDEGCFTQLMGRCSQLREDGLCKLQAAYGEEVLCETCKRYPRHIEEFDGEREYSLSLSCPEAARIILEDTNKLCFEEWETDEEDDFEEFDFILYSKLMDARSVMFDIIQNRELDIKTRMNILMKLALELQECEMDDDIFAMDDVIDEYKGCTGVDYDITFKQDMLYFSKLYELEMLHENWFDTLDKVGKTFTNDNFLSLSDKMSICAEQLLMFFVYTYFLGAVYDDMIYSKIALSVYSVRWILMIYHACKTKEDDIDTLIKTAYTYAREVEHSDLNLDDLEEFLDRQL